MTLTRHRALTATGGATPHARLRAAASLRGAVRPAAGSPLARLRAAASLPGAVRPAAGSPLARLRAAAPLRAAVRPAAGSPLARLRAAARLGAVVPFARLATAAGGSAVLLGVGADVVFGDPRRAHPVAAFGRVAGAFERLVYRPTRCAGAVYAAVLVGGAAALGALLERALPKPVARAVCLWVALGGRSLRREATAVGELVERDDLVGARRRIRSLVGRDPERLDSNGLSRAVVESVAENTVDAVVAPLVWLRVGGAPGVLAYRAVNTLDAMVGNRSPRYERFGTPAARADDVMNWPAARVAAALTVLLSGRPAATWCAWREDAGKHPSPNAGQIEAAFAGALGVQLGGTLAYAGRVEHRPQLGDGRDPGPADIARAVALARRISLAAALLASIPSSRRGRLAAPARRRRG